MGLTSELSRQRVRDEGRLVARADAALPQTATTTYFTIAGTIELLDLDFTVGTVIQTQTCNMTVKYTPTGGSAIDLCTATNISAVAAGGKIALQPLTDAGAVQSLTLTPVGALTQLLAEAPFKLSDGVLAVTMSASNTGTLSAALRYRPFASNGRVAAA